LKIALALLLVVAGVSASAAESAAENKSLAPVEKVIFIDRELPVVDAKLETPCIGPTALLPGRSRCSIMAQRG
jgi:hypothetical protein